MKQHSPKTVLRLLSLLAGATSEEGRPAGSSASSFNRAAFAGACAGYEKAGPPAL